MLLLALARRIESLNRVAFVLGHVPLPAEESLPHRFLRPVGPHGVAITSDDITPPNRRPRTSGARAAPFFEEVGQRLTECLRAGWNRQAAAMRSSSGRLTHVFLRDEPIVVGALYPLQPARAKSLDCRKPFTGPNPPGRPSWVSLASRPSSGMRSMNAREGVASTAAARSDSRCNRSPCGALHGARAHGVALRLPRMRINWLISG